MNMLKIIPVIVLATILSVQPTLAIADFRAIMKNGHAMVVGSKTVVITDKKGNKSAIGAGKHVLNTHKKGLRKPDKYGTKFSFRDRVIKSSRKLYVVHTTVTARIKKKVSRGIIKTTSRRIRNSNRYSVKTTMNIVFP